MSAPTAPAPGLALSTGGINAAKTIFTGLATQRVMQQRRDERGLPVNTNDLGVVHCNRVEALWRSQGRQVLSMHPGLVAEVRMATSSKIVPEVFATLPYRDPLVVFPGGVATRSWKDGETMRCLGFFTHGRVDDPSGMIYKNGTDANAAFDKATRIVSTHDAGSGVFSVIIVNQVLTDGKSGDGPPLLEYNRISLPLDRPTALKDIVEQKVANYGWDGDHSRASQYFSPSGAEAGKKTFMRDQLSLVLGTTMYLCSTVLDAEVVPRSRIRRAWGQTRQVPNLINVGWRIGPALTAARAEARQKEASALPGRSLPPHQRRAHFKTVWTGEGRSIPKTVFISPYWVRKELMHLVDTKTVRAVK